MGAKGGSSTFKELFFPALALTAAIFLPACLPCSHLFREGVPGRGMTKSKSSTVGELKAWTPIGSSLVLWCGGKCSWGQRPGPAHRRLRLSDQSGASPRGN